MLIAIITETSVNCFDENSFILDKDGKPTYFFSDIDIFIKHYENDIDTEWFATKNINKALNNTYIFFRGLKRQNDYC